jgi:hypothetical protein
MKKLCSSPSLQSDLTIGYGVDIDFSHVHLCNHRNQVKLSSQIEMITFSRVHLCNQRIVGTTGIPDAGSATPVPYDLKCPVSLNFIRITASIGSIVIRVGLKPLLMTQVLLGPVIVITFQFEALPGRLAGTLAPRFSAVILFAVAGNKKDSTTHTRNRLHVVSPESNQLKELEKLYGLFNFKTELNGRNQMAELNRCLWRGIKSMVLAGN